jgi:phosphatidylserine decarboxylase
VETYDGQGSVIRFLYATALGRRVLEVLVQPWVSRLGGWFLSRRVSRLLVGPFVQKNHLDLADYPRRRYTSFNDFFTRQILPDRRPIDQDPRHLIAPCDSKLTAIPLDRETRFAVKGVSYTLESLLRDGTLAQRYQGGTLLLFRLSVDDYHRYCYAVAGRRYGETHIQGVYHTVSPHGAALEPVYRENTREYALVETEEFGVLLTMEVGALLVGKIQNHPAPAQVQRGQEKGMFLFGGSTVILVLEQGRVALDEDILRNSLAGEETIVKMGEKIGTATETALI